MGSQPEAVGWKASANEKAATIASSGIETLPIEGRHSGYHDLMEVAMADQMNQETVTYSPSGPGDVAGSDPTSTENGDSDDNGEEDPGEGQIGSTSSRERRDVRKRSEASLSSEELIAGEDPPTSPKRNLEGAAEQSEAVRQRIDEGTGEVERPEKVARGEPSARVLPVNQVQSVKEIETFLRTEHPR